jgi:hypothetical protein
MDFKLFLNDKLYWHFYKRRASQHTSRFKNKRLYFPEKPIYMNLVPTDLISQQIAFTGAYEYNLSKRIMSTAKKCNKTLVDVGANLGYFSLLFASASPDNKVFAFEASPKNHDLLSQNIKINQLNNQVKVYPVAAGKETGKLSFSLGNSDQTGWGGFSFDNTGNNVEVDVVALDDYF